MNQLKTPLHPHLIHTLIWETSMCVCVHVCACVYAGTSCSSSDDEDKEDGRVDSNDPEEMFQNIQYQKEIIANIRTRPWPMRRKLKVLKYT